MPPAAQVAVAPPGPGRFAQPAAPGCTHYKRNCEVLAPCCQRFFTCHLCHDEAGTAHYGKAGNCLHDMAGSTSRRRDCYFDAPPPLPLYL